MSGYLAPDIPAKQWEVAKRQLEAFRQGKPLPIWEAVGEALCRLRAGWRLDEVTLLDAGSSSGYFSEIIEYYVPNWVKYRGLDYNPYMLKVAAKHYPDVQVDLGDIRDTGYEDRAFDVVMTGCVVNHVYDWQEAVRELARVAKHYLLFHRLPFANGPTRFEDAEAYGHPVLAVFFNEDEFGRVLAEEGFNRMYNKPVGDLRTQIWKRK